MKNVTVTFVDGKKMDHLVSPPFLAGEAVNVFETMRVHEGVIFRLKEHLDRLFASAKTTDVSIPESRENIEKKIARALEQAPEKTCGLRLMVEDKRTVISIFKRFYSEQIYKMGVEIRTSVVRRNSSSSLPPEAKTGQFLNGVLARLDFPAASPFETLFLDAAGFVKEARVSNIFMVKNGQLKTPVSSGILDGVTRRFVIECARKERFSVEETELTRHDIWNAEEVFLTNTSGGIVPVRSLDRRLIGRKTPGPVTQKVSERFQKEFEREINLKHASH